MKRNNQISVVTELSKLAKIINKADYWNTAVVVDRAKDNPRLKNSEFRYQIEITPKYISNTFDMTLTLARYVEQFNDEYNEIGTGHDRIIMNIKALDDGSIKAILF